MVGVKEGGWWVHFSYFSQDGRLKGEIYSINTPAEFYKDYIRYIDLEIDVVKFPFGQIRVIDREELNEKVSRGIINKDLACKAIQLAEGIERGRLL